MDSGILYSAVARPGVILVSDQRGDGDYESVVQNFLPNISGERNTKACYVYNQHTYHVLVEDMLIYICVCETEFGKNVPFSFLQEVRKKFTSGSLAVRAFSANSHDFDRDFINLLSDLMVKYSTGHVDDSIGKVKNQVNEVMIVMNQNIEKVLERGEKVEELLDKTSELELTATQFHSTSRKVRRKMWCRNVKMWIICLSVVAVVVTIVILMATGVIPLK